MKATDFYADVAALVITEIESPYIREREMFRWGVRYRFSLHSGNGTSLAALSIALAKTRFVAYSNTFIICR